jgi:hypothetical protein
LTRDTSLQVILIRVHNSHTDMLMTLQILMGSMATNQVKAATEGRQRQFNWGETTRLRGDANVPGRAGSIAEVCGIVVIETAEHARAVIGGSIGKDAYLIEFGDGGSVEVVSELSEKHSGSAE